MIPRSAQRSAGIVLYRGRGDLLEVLLVHPGGPAWAKRDAGAWSIPKGEFEPEEDPLEAAAEALAAFGVAAEDAATGAQGPGTFHARLYDALYALDPSTLDARTRIAL